MPGRTYTAAGGYRHGFNSQENDNELKGEGNSVDFGARIYDPRLGRWLSVDPLYRQYPNMSPYVFAMNNPIFYVDEDGREPSPAAYEAAAKKLGTTIEVIKAVYFVETGGTAFYDNGDPKMLFERHYFKEKTGGKYDKTNPDLSGAYKAGSYGKYSAQKGRLEDAVKLDKDAAYQSASFGGFQIMGSNYAASGYADAESFAKDMMSKDEDKHLAAFVSFVSNNSTMQTALKDMKWADFAKLYNGPKYADNKYDTKLLDAYNKFKKEADDKAAAEATFMESQTKD